MSRPFIPRPYQIVIREQILLFKRYAVWVFMGGGKTSAMISGLDMLSMVENDVYPVLVLAPLRVANNVWPAEQQKWQDFSHIKMQRITGTAAERKRALSTTAHIYTMNYENMEWLIKELGPQNWPFKTVIADESTKLKGFRLRQGTARARALSLVAWTKVQRFYNLTGTPSPNGLKDLWGQTWFLDKGERLGRAYDAFTQRWFQRSFDGYSIDPLPFAQEQIQAKLADICISLDPRDYFDIRKPVIINVYVDLPKEAQELYNKMEKEMFVQIEEHPIEAFNAAARTNKCIAEGTLVLSKRGWYPIEAIISTDLVWDGIEWVSVAKSLCNGYREVVECWGVKMTPDHKILTQDGWKEAQEIIDGESSKRFIRSEIRLPDNCATGWEPETSRWYFSKSCIKQYPAQRKNFDSQRQNAYRSGCSGLWNKIDNFAAKNKKQMAKVTTFHTTEKMRVYDIVNAGPRNRFLVMDKNGAPLIVHNCAQLANGAAYIEHLDPENAAPKDWKVVHNVKIEALDNIIEEAGGAPVLVAYEFKSDLARLKKAFPQGRTFDTNPKTEEDWNAGKIPLMFVHPASAGHGSNLQYGGYILVFFGHSWNLEQFLQIIERIGPVRQIQAGFDRNVFLYFIIVRNTIDEDFMVRRNTKKQVQDILLESMKRRREV